MFKKLGKFVPLVSAAVASIVEFLFSLDYIQLRVADAVIIGLLALLALDALSERLGLLEQINAKLKRLSEAKPPSGEIIVEVQKEGEDFVFKIRSVEKSS
jgi:hypothetical protein